MTKEEISALLERIYDAEKGPPNMSEIDKLLTDCAQAIIKLSKCAS